MMSEYISFVTVSEIPANRKIKKILYQYYKPNFDQTK